ncbi:hypothetical protein ACFQLX_13030 [Streptomyces polyrhachis]|uniref:Uncharacterized protein n=1 Tax=Streptomyces polyrhachis TaxID=1282885 RepID=A0ABW2GEQ6_9ACTN
MHYEFMNASRRARIERAEQRRLVQEARRAAGAAAPARIARGSRDVFVRAA